MFFIYRKPFYTLNVNGKDLTPILRGFGGQKARLESLTLTDNRGGEADELNLTLDDSDGMLEIPPKGAIIKLAIGFAETELIDKGSFTVDEITHSGAPDKLTIKARSANFRESFTEKKEKSWHKKTLGDILETIASEQGLTVAIPAHLKNIEIPHVDQTDESDINFLTRIAAQHGAFLNVKDEHLILMDKGGHKTVSGEDFEIAIFTRKDGDNHNFSFCDRDAKDNISAAYYDLGKAEKCTVNVGNETGKKKQSIRHIYPNKAAAEKAAAAALKYSQARAAKMSLNLAIGRPEIQPDMKAKLHGWKHEIDDREWTIVKITHSLNNSGLTSQIEFETV